MSTALTTEKDNSLAKKMTGPEKAATFLLSLPDDHLKKIFAKLDPMEVLELSQKMSTLGIVKSESVEEVYSEFMGRVGSSGSLMGSFETTERMLIKFFEKDKVRDIMEEIRGPAGRTMWEKLGNVSEGVLASYLKNEHPQTAAVILSKIKPEHAAKVFALLPEPLALDVMGRMIRMDVVSRDILDDVEQTLKTEFMTNVVKTSQRDPYQLVAEIFNSFDRSTEGRFMSALEEKFGDAAEKVKSLMFTFNDLIKLDATGTQTVIRVVDKAKLGMALKGASEEIKELFFKNMSERAAKLLKEDMQAMGMVRLRDVDEAQLAVVTQAKELINKGEIQINVGGSDDEMVG